MTASAWGSQLVSLLAISVVTGGCNEPAPPAASAPASVSSQRLDSEASPVDFDADGTPDQALLVAVQDLQSDVVERNAFGYGESVPGPAHKCIEIQLTALRPGSHKVLCGKSSVLVLAEKRGPLTPARTLKKGSEEISAHIGDTALGDVLTLATQATDLAIYWTAEGFRWEEMDGGE